MVFALIALLIVLTLDAALAAAEPASAGESG